MSADELAAVDKLKVVELKARLGEYGLSTAGLKADLAARLKQHIVDQASGGGGGGGGDESNGSAKASDATEDHSPPSGPPDDSCPPSPGQPEADATGISDKAPVAAAQHERLPTPEDGSLPDAAEMPADNDEAQGETVSDVVMRSPEAVECEATSRNDSQSRAAVSAQDESELLAADAELKDAQTESSAPKLPESRELAQAQDDAGDPPSPGEPEERARSPPRQHTRRRFTREAEPPPTSSRTGGEPEAPPFSLKEAEEPHGEERKIAPTLPPAAKPPEEEEKEQEAPGQQHRTSDEATYLNPVREQTRDEELDAGRREDSAAAREESEEEETSRDDSQESMDMTYEERLRGPSRPRREPDGEQLGRGGGRSTSSSDSQDSRELATDAAAVAAAARRQRHAHQNGDCDEGHVSPVTADRDEMENDTVQSPLNRRQEESSNEGRSEGASDGDDESQQSANRSRNNMDEVVRKNLELLESAERQARTTMERRKAVDIHEVLQQKGIELPEKKANETKNQKKKRRKKTRRIIKTIQKEAAGSDGDSGRETELADVEIDYVPDQVEKDLSWFQFTKVFEKFKFEEPSQTEEVKETVPDPVALKISERKKPANLTDDEDEDDDKKDDDTPKLSKKKLKQLTRMSVAELKIKVNHPELVEMHDVTSKDPVFLLTLKATRNSVPVPRHWCFKRKYLQGKRGIEKPPFDLPDFIKRTGICEMRAALQEKEEAKTLKSKQREKVRPKMGKIDIDYQKLHDAFFKWQEKPRLSMHGDLYYEGKEFETRLKEKKPGELSDELRTALGMPIGPNAHKCPPPWLIAMQRYGPPPSYPNLKIPGLNAAIPEACSFGYHAGGWGKPPVDESGKPLYGDVFGVTVQEGGVAQVEQDIDKMYLFGTMDEEASSEEEESDSDEGSDAAEEPDETGLVTPAEGLATPSGLQSSLSHAGLETPDAIELRKRKIEAEMEMGDQVPQLYTVLGERRTERLGHTMMGSAHTYEIPGTASTGPTGKKAPVELALDPSELEMDPGAMAARYEQTVREQQSQLAKEDFSDMVAEHAAKQKNKRKAREEAGAAGGKKKYKEFKF